MFAQRRLLKLCRLHNVEGVDETNIEVRRIASRTIGGVQFVIRAASPLDIMAGEINLQTYADEKDKRRVEKQADLARNNPKFAEEQYKKFREECIKLFEKTVLVPKLGASVTAEDLANNLEICNDLYGWIIENSVGKKKRKLFS